MNQGAFFPLPPPRFVFIRPNLAEMFAHRRIFSAIFLGIFLLVGFFELAGMGAQAYISHLMAKPVPPAPVCHSHAEAPKKACAGCCGPTCTMGEFCRCGEELPTRPAGVVFAYSAGCHPHEGTHSMVPPATMGFQYLRPAFQWNAFADCIDATRSPRVPGGHAGWIATPEPPPPRHASA